MLIYTLNCLLPSEVSSPALFWLAASTTTKIELPVLMGIGWEHMGPYPRSIGLDGSTWGPVQGL